MISVCYFGADGGNRTRTLENEKQIFIPPRLSPPPRGVFVVWTIPSPWPKSCRRRPSSLYTFLSRGLARDWRWRLPLAFPDFERFYSQRFRWGTPIEVCCVYRFRHVRITCDLFIATWFNIQGHHSMPQLMPMREVCGHSPFSGRARRPGMGFYFDTTNWLQHRITETSRIRRSHHELSRPTADVPWSPLPCACECPSRRHAARPPVLRQNGRQAIVRLMVGPVSAARRQRANPQALVAPRDPGTPPIEADSPSVGSGRDRQRGYTPPSRIGG
jgi:hypothetical protein